MNMLSLGVSYVNTTELKHTAPNMNHHKNNKPY